MRHVLFWTGLVGLLGCNKGDGDSATDTSLEPQVVGTITVPDQDAEGRVEIFHGYGVDAGGTVMMYLSSNPNLSCAMAAEILSDRENPLDFTDYIVGGTCDLFIKLFDYTGEASFTDDIDGRVGMTINCYTGNGAFQYEQRDDGGDNGSFDDEHDADLLLQEEQDGAPRSNGSNGDVRERGSRSNSERGLQL